MHHMLIILVLLHRLFPLDKIPGVYPIRSGEVLQIIVVIRIARQDLHTICCWFFLYNSVLATLVVVKLLYIHI